MLYKKVLLKILAKSTRKHLCWRLFLKSLQAFLYRLETSENKNFSDIFRGYRKVCKFIKKRLQHRCFTVNIVKFLRTTILEYLRTYVNGCFCHYKAAKKYNYFKQAWLEKTLYNAIGLKYF